ncbi:MAG: ribonuclease P protein component [Gammaproteobacteria bacterium]|nr:ribonuclease P protein component [Gammaproteobacteria bacterium]
MATCRFRKRNRLLTAREYDRVFKQASHRIHTREFLMLAADNERDVSRLGTVVSKKVAGNAVERNRMRRLLKETFRLSRVDSGVDVVFVARPPAGGKSNTELTEVLYGMWRKLAAKRAQ